MERKIRNPYVFQPSKNYLDTQALNFRTELAFMKRVGPDTRLYGGVTGREAAVRNFKGKTKRNREFFKISTQLAAQGVE